MSNLPLLRQHMDRLRGELFQAVESWGPPEVQEDAIKGVIRRITYDAQADLETLLRGRNARNASHHP